MRKTVNGKTYRSEAEWREIFERLARSGKTQSEFCTHEGIALTSLQKWQRKLESSEEKPSFVEITSSLSSAAKRSEVELRFPSGLILSIGG